MTDQEFCKIMKAFDGEPIDKVEQLTHIRFTGRELKEFCDHVEQQVNSVDLADVVKSWSEIKDGDEFTVKCKVVKGKFELNLD